MSEGPTTLPPVDLVATRRPDGTMLLTSRSWPGFRYLIAASDGLHQAITIFEPLFEAAQQRKRRPN